MLLSPGHSPRLISTLHSSTAFNPRKRDAAVLDEESYIAAIERIIERDFFPDIPKLRDRLDWLEAVGSGDPVLILDAQLKIIERRAAAAGGSSAATASARRSRTRTLGSSYFPSFSATPFGSTPSTRHASSDYAAQTAPDDPLADIDTSLSLDDFLLRYTSEDNESFSKILEKANRKKRVKYAHLLEGEKEPALLALEEEKRDRITDRYGTSGQPVSTLEDWKYTAMNLLMYNPTEREEAPLTEEERAERLKGLTKQIDRFNTRFHGKSAPEAKPTKDEEAAAILYTPVAGTTPAWPFADREAEKSKRYDLEDLRKTPYSMYVDSTKKAENGYGFVRTPSPAPGVDESPFMTWGEIEGTPLRLDLEESSVDIGGSSDGPHFRIPLPSSRDVKAHSLAGEAARKARERSKMFKKPPLPSPAAQKFVRRAIAKSSSSVDETLRTSYRGSTPFSITPKEKSRFSRDESLASRSPPSRPGYASPW